MYTLLFLFQNWVITKLLLSEGRGIFDEIKLSILLRSLNVAEDLM